MRTFDLQGRGQPGWLTVWPPTTNSLLIDVRESTIGQLTMCTVFLLNGWDS